MPFNERVSQSHSQSLVISVVLALLLGLVSLGLFARQNPAPSQQQANSNSSFASHCSPASSSADPKVAAADASALLPLIPMSGMSHPSDQGGIVGLLPGEQPTLPNHDDSKVLYGYSGPFYNTTDLDNQVVVLDQTVYTWPTSTWKVTGLLRNQTRCPIHIASLTARLLRPSGQLLATATSSLPVVDLRPGEPAPFTFEAPIARVEVKSVEWHIDFVPDVALPTRLLEFAIGREEADTRYYLDGTIRNMATSTAQGVRVIVAWLDPQSNRVLYSAPAAIRTFEDPKSPVEAMDLRAGETEQFVFVTTDPMVVSIIGPTKVVLWGVSR